MIRNTVALKRGANTSTRDDQKNLKVAPIASDKYWAPTLTSRLDCRAVTLSVLRQGYNGDHCNIQLYIRYSIDISDDILTSPELLKATDCRLPDFGLNTYDNIVL